MLVYVRPDKRVKSGSVSGGADTDFQDDWLIDTRPYYPAKKTGSVTWTVTPDAVRDVDVFAIVNHVVPVAGTVTFSIGGVTLTVPAYSADGTAFNVGTKLGATVSTGATFTVAGTDLLIGDLWVGESESLPGLLMQRELDLGDTFPWESDIQPEWDEYGEPRRYTGQMILNDMQFDQLKAWYRSTKRGTEPTLIFLGEDDEWLLAQFKFTAQHNEGWHFVQIEIVEVPRTTF